MTGAAVLLVMAGFTLAGPLRPGWSHRAGTSSALLAQLCRRSSHLVLRRLLRRQPLPRPLARRAGIPSTPFDTSVSGTVATTPPDANGDSEVTLTMQLGDTTAPLTVRIVGPSENGGVAMRRSVVSFGALTGQVTALDGSSIGAVVNGPSGSLSLTINVSLDRAAGTLTGQVSGSAVQ